MFDVVQRMARHDAAMAVVIKGRGRGRPSEIVGIISKEHIADSVAESIKPFGLINTAGEFHYEDETCISCGNVVRAGSDISNSK